jgi:hypothetical protein
MRDTSEGIFICMPIITGFLSPKIIEISPRIKKTESVNVKMRNGFIIE